MAHVLQLLRMAPERVAAQLPGIDVRPADTVARAHELAVGAVAVLSGWLVDEVPVDADLAAVLAPTCRLVQVPAAGLDAVDPAALRAHGIPLASAAGLNDTAVAEWCVWAVIDALRGLSDAHGRLADGHWAMFGGARPRHELAGRRVGIIGMGAIGRALVPRLAAFDVELSYANRSRHTDVEERHGIVHRSLDELLTRCDVVVLVVAAVPATRGLLSADRLALLPPGAVVVNAARGEVWDEAAVAAAVAGDGGPLAAATDVYVDEPPPAGHPLVGADRITATPHVAGPVIEVMQRIWARTRTNLRTAVAGGGDFEGLLGPDGRPAHRGPTAD